MTTLYIAGPMSGLPDFNYPAFNRAEVQLICHGYTALNPVFSTRRVDAPRRDLSHQGGEWSDYLRNAINQLIRADGVALLPDWHQSKGARLEVHVAEQLGMSCRPLDAWLVTAREGATA